MVTKDIMPNPATLCPFLPIRGLKTLCICSWSYAATLVTIVSCNTGVQIATKQIDEGVKAAQMAAEAGADWVDLNCGCPIYGKASCCNSLP